MEEILARSGKLAENSEYKKIWIKKDMNREEREREREVREEAKEKNDRRTESEKQKFYWRILDMKLRRWYYREQLEVQQQNTGAQGEKVEENQEVQRRAEEKLEEGSHR